jgi:hypothetical protein
MMKDTDEGFNNHGSGKLVDIIPMTLMGYPLENIQKTIENCP